MRDDPLPAPTTAGDAIDRWVPTLDAWVASLSSDNTRTAYRADLVRFGQWCADRRALPLQVTATDVVAYQRDVEATGVSAATARRRTSSLSSFFEFALAAGVVERNPVRNTKRLSDDDASTTPRLSVAAVDQLIDAAAALDARALALVGLLAFDGLQLNEALALDTSDVTSVAPCRVSVTVQRATRSIEIALDHRTGPAVLACVADHLLKRLPSHDATPLTANALRRFFVTAVHDAGISLAERAATDR